MDMRTAWLGLMLACSNLHAQLLFNSVVPQDEAYYTKTLRNIELIYSEDNLPFAREAAKIELLMQPLYEQVYGYQMDETLYVGLISKYNQIANGFSTQYPNNRQINYIGGPLTVDYFSSPSWLKTLLYHETAHNYQTNVKESPVSSGLHSVIGNGAFFIPWFTIPNILESSFLLEGNAVLNESWHGNGGRLYSGRFKAATLQQAKAGKLEPELVYNDNYSFLYSSHFYTLGGYYQYYLAENYGLDKVNNYWKQHSREWYFPVYTNNATKRAIGVNFDTTFADWRRQMEAEAEKLVDVTGDDIASSQFFKPLSDDADEIYFIVNESGRSFPALVIYDKASGKVTESTSSYDQGKVIKLDDGRYATQSSANTSPWRIYQGLFDEEAIIIDGTQSKIIEGYLADGSAVYFDVPSSFDQPQLYVGDKFYARVNSSVFIDRQDNLYYFVQGDGKTRTLYKNKEALLTIKGYYSYVSGVDSKGAVYFIANTSNGSGLFRSYDGKVSRAHAADTIIDARLIDDNSALVAVMGADRFSYKRIALSAIDETPHEVKLFVENEPYYRADDIALHPVDTPKIDLEDPYYSLLNMNYSGTNIAFGEDSNAGFIYNIDIIFADPLTQNALSAFILRNTDEYTLGGAGYANNQYFIQYDVTAYDILDRPDNSSDATDRREYGLIANAYLPFLSMGHYYATLRSSYYEDYESNSRKPLSAALDLMRGEQYGVSMYPNFLLYASPYVSSDRGDNTTGGEASFEHSLPQEFYFGIGGQYSSSDATSNVDSRGVKLTNDQFEKFQDSDPSTVVMPGLKDTSYFRRVTKASLNLKKVFNLSSYSFKYPVSLRRESLYAVYNYYDIEPFTSSSSSTDNEQVNEFIAGITLDTYWLHRLPIPITMEYIYNDNDTIGEENTFRFYFGLLF
jgi:hypothetical protein